MFTKAQRLRKRFLRLPQRKRDQARAYQRAKAVFPRPGFCLDPLPLPPVSTAGSGGISTPSSRCCAGPALRSWLWKLL